FQERPPRRTWVRARVIATIRAEVPISFATGRRSPARRPRTSPEATIVGKLRHGRNTAARRRAFDKRRRSLEPLDDRGDPLPEPDAQGREPVAGLPLLELV